MNPDLALVLGVIFLGLAVPSFLNAYSESRAPRAAMMMALIAAGLIAFAVSRHPQGYTIQDVPDVFVRVIGAYIN